jgi:DNA-binding FadR family transcriptional regulator
VNASPEELAVLRELVDEIESTFAKRELDGYVAADTGFHEVLAVATHNELISAIVAGLEEVMKQWIKAQTEARLLEAGARSHRGIYEAIAARDPDRAREAMRFHMRTARLALFDTNESPIGAHEDGQAMEPSPDCHPSQPS